MVGIVVVTRAALLIARRASTWTVDEHLAGLSPGCVAVDLSSPAQVYCGTARAGLFRSRDSGRNWEPVGRGIDHPMVTAVDVGHAEQADGLGIVYAGTEPSAVFRSDTGGDSWVDLAGLRALPSADTWSFPPPPQTRVLGTRAVPSIYVREDGWFGRHRHVLAEGIRHRRAPRFDMHLRFEAMRPENGGRLVGTADHSAIPRREHAVANLLNFGSRFLNSLIFAQVFVQNNLGPIRVQ